MIRQLQKYQQEAYCLVSVDIIQQFLIQLPIKKESELYEMSVACEAKKGDRSSMMSPGTAKKRGFLKKAPSKLGIEITEDKKKKLFSKKGKK